MKRLIKAILWIGCYGGAGWFVIKTGPGFDILSQEHWKMLFDRSAHAFWSSEVAERKLVCKILLGFIIIGILGLAIVTKKKKPYTIIAKEELPKKESFRPAPMASQGRIAAPVVTPNGSGFSANQGMSGAQGVEPPRLNLMSEAIKRISDVANNFEVSIFPHVKLENTFTHLVISDDSNALLLKILPQPGTWQVQQASDPSESVWTLDGQNPHNILKDIIQSTQTLARLEPEANSTAVVILTNSTLENPNEVRQYLAQSGIRIATLLPDNKKIPEIPSWQELLKEFYLPKESEEKNETNDNPQNL